MLKRNRILEIFCMPLIIALARSVNAATIYVLNNYTTIQWVVNNAYDSGYNISGDNNQDNLHLAIP